MVGDVAPLHGLESALPYSPRALHWAGFLGPWATRDAGTPKSSARVVGYRQVARGGKLTKPVARWKQAGTSAARSMDRDQISILATICEGFFNSGHPLLQFLVDMGVDARRDVGEVDLAGRHERTGGRQDVAGAASGPARSGPAARSMAPATHRESPSARAGPAPRAVPPPPRAISFRRIVIDLVHRSLLTRRSRNQPIGGRSRLLHQTSPPSHL